MDFFSLKYFLLYITSLLIFNFLPNFHMFIKKIFIFYHKIHALNFMHKGLKIYVKIFVTNEIFKSCLSKGSLYIYIYIYMKKNYRKKLKQIYEKVDLLEDLSFNFVII